jgi:hypothetical protein
MVQYLVNDELGRMCKEAVMAYFKVSFLKMSGGTNHKNFSGNGQSLD